MTRIEIRPIDAQQTWPLRLKVLRPQQTLKDCIFPQDEAKEAFHVGAWSGDRIVGIASFHIEAHPDLLASSPYRLRGMATDPDFQGRGVGRKVLQAALQILKDKGCDLLWCNARETAFPFYEKQGFSYWGSLFDIPGVGPHKVMFLRRSSGF